jgi:hypothetical protein
MGWNSDAGKDRIDFRVELFQYGSHIETINKEGRASTTIRMG